uniref:Uncharacterized protein, isoform B n=1 Tax=Drosophila melanogaster TaxID=7227 RepID=M9MRC8_DROME|nr:uncharacterized protein Dmel_CG31949, isoform B [Drosophila melanogaster]ADV36934.1 uncharacterized protein Dmel_CG31949, isoform B [Drosophila melanogaster]|eukprot:NP_001188683.1 uncharacterized protein Dmel_CG31949, isoform B [Drosophila melanogaster]
MEASFMVALFLSLFFHCTGLVPSPVEARPDSLLFLLIAIIFLHKLKMKYGPILPETITGAILEVPVLCLALQVALLVLWGPMFYILQWLVDSASRNLRYCLNEQLSLMISDMQKFFGCKEDCVTPSVLSFIAEEETKMLKRDIRKWKKTHKK